MPSDYHGACEMCGALYYWSQVYAPKNWRTPDDLTDAKLVSRLQCDHILSKHAPLYTEVQHRKSEPTRALFDVAPRRVSHD